MARKPTVVEERRHLRYLVRLLERDDLAPEYRAELERKEIGIRARIASHCSICNRTLRDPESLKRGIGPECWGRVAA